MQTHGAMEVILGWLAAGAFGDPRKDIGGCIRSPRDDLYTALPEIEKYNAGSLVISLVYQYKTQLEARANPDRFILLMARRKRSSEY